jgi:hypothetical protein
MRLSPSVTAALDALLSGAERPSIVGVLRALDERGLEAPSRASLYKYLSLAHTRERRAGDLPAPAREALYNVGEDSRVPEAQIAFYCFNYGSSAAMSWAAALPWLPLYQASRMRGWRPKSRGVLEAVLRVRFTHGAGQEGL